MSVILRPLTRAECHEVGVWRSRPDVSAMLRTGAKTAAEQDVFFETIASNPQGDHRYWAVEQGGSFVAIGGLTYLSRRIGEAEISLVVNPDYWRKGIGLDAVGALLTAARRADLDAVIGESYRDAPNIGFWQKAVSRLHGTGMMWGRSYYFRFDLRAYPFNGIAIEPSAETPWAV